MCVFPSGSVTPAPATPAPELGESVSSDSREISCVTSNDPPQARDFRTIAEYVILVVLTPVVALVVWLVASSSERGRLQLEYVRIATGILQQSDTAEAQRPMREWAVALLNKSAPVKLSADQAESLTNGSSTLPPLSDTGGGYDTYGSSDWYSIVPNKRRRTDSPSPTATPR